MYVHIYKYTCIYQTCDVCMYVCIGERTFEWEGGESRVCVCACVRACMYVYIRNIHILYTYIHIYMYVYVCICMYIAKRTLSGRVEKVACACMCAWVCTYVCMYTYVI
jgi:hypothetical protein